MKPYFQRDNITLYHGDCREVLRALPDASVNCCVTSPPYWGLRDYGHGAQIGLEQTPTEYVQEMILVFREVRRVLRDDGTLWLNLGDSYGHSLRQSANKSGDKQNTNQGSIRRGFAPIAIGLKEKDLVGIPWRVAFALQSDGWYLRQDIIWSKPNPMPESVTDRCTKAHEYIFLLSKLERYFYDAAAIAEPVTGGTHGGAKRPSTLVGRNAITTRGGKESSGLGMGWERPDRNRRSVWTVTTKPYSGAHFATFPPDLIEPCIRAGCPNEGVVLDPFFGAGTTGVVCDQQHVRCIGIELNRDYCDIAAKRLAQGVLFGAKESA